MEFLNLTTSKRYTLSLAEIYINYIFIQLKRLDPYSRSNPISFELYIFAKASLKLVALQSSMNFMSFQSNPKSLIDKYLGSYNKESKASLTILI